MFSYMWTTVLCFLYIFIMVKIFVYNYLCICLCEDMYKVPMEVGRGNQIPQELQVTYKPYDVGVGKRILLLALPSQFDRVGS